MWDREAEAFLCPDDVEEGDVGGGVPEDHVRLDECLSEPGDVLRYVYDYGDEWSHVLKLEKMNPEPCGRPRAVAGKYEAPLEDSGGVCAWNENPELEFLDLDVLNEDLVDWAANLGLAP